MANEALLVMDVQNGVVDRYAKNAASLLSTLGRAVSAARSGGVPVVYVRVAFREGAPEISPRNQTFATFAGARGMGESDSATQVHAAVAPAPGDIFVVKRRVSAFSGSDLDVVLRSLGVNALVLTGIATSGVVLSTLREAADLDYVITVLEDGCLDADDEVHRMLMEKVFPRQATVLTADAWTRYLGGGHSAPS
jgi:nicotinamidase-related amidase